MIYVCENHMLYAHIHVITHICHSFHIILAWSRDSKPFFPNRDSPKVKGPMILTGFGALNKLLGKKVYTSQDQLGGPQVIALFSRGAGLSRVEVIVKDSR